MGSYFGIIRSSTPSNRYQQTTGNSITVDDNDNLYITGKAGFYSQFGLLNTYPYSVINCNYECTYVTQLLEDGDWGWTESNAYSGNTAYSTGESIDYHNGVLYVAGGCHGLSQHPNIVAVKTHATKELVLTLLGLIPMM